MTPSDYAAQFSGLSFFRTTPSDGRPAPVSMYLPDPRTPGKVAGKPIEPGRWTRLSVDRYRLGDSGRGYPLIAALKSAAFIDVRVRTIRGEIQTRRLQLAEVLYALRAPFAGKGYPEECQIVLQLWERYGMLGTADALVASGAIGLDCNGFVGGYIDRRAAPDSWLRRGSTKTGYYINDLLGPASRYFKSFDDFAGGEASSLLLGLCDAAGTVLDHDPNDPSKVGHIAITEPGTLVKVGASGPVTLDAVESHGPLGKVGLERSAYTILSMTSDATGHAVFRVRRGSRIGTPFEFGFFRITRLP